MITESKGFLASLFDVSFSEMVTTKIIKVLYIIAMVTAGLTALGMVVGGFSGSVGGGLVSLVLAPVVFFLQILFFRVWLEIIIVVFKIAENTSHLVKDKADSSV